MGMRPFNIYVHPDFSYEPEEDSRKGVSPIAVGLVSLAVAAPTAALVLHQFAPQMFAEIVQSVGAIGASLGR